MFTDKSLGYIFYVQRQRTRPYASSPFNWDVRLCLGLVALDWCRESWAAVDTHKVSTSHPYSPTTASKQAIPNNSDNTTIAAGTPTQSGMTRMSQHPHHPVTTTGQGTTKMMTVTTITATPTAASNCPWDENDDHQGQGEGAGRRGNSNDNNSKMGWWQLHHEPSPSFVLFFFFSDN